MSTKCFVPNCKNPTGVPFPKSPEQKKKWLESLKIKHIVPNPSSFVCLEHFAEEDVIEEHASDEIPENRVKKDAIPSTSSPRKKVKNETEDIPEVNEGVEENNLKNICRLCMTSLNVNTSIYSNVDESTTIVSAILSCLHPLQISKDDDLSKEICDICLESLKNYHKFRNECLEVDGKQRKDGNVLKRKASISEKPNDIKKPRTLEDLTNELREEFDDDDNDNDNEISIPEYHIKKEVVTEPQKMQASKSKPVKLPILPMKIISSSNDNHNVKSVFLEPPPVLTPSKKGKQIKKDVDKKFDKVEEELRKVLEGQLTEEQIAAENIIIEVESDDAENKEKLPQIEAKIKRVHLPVNTKSSNIIKPNNNIVRITTNNSSNSVKILPKSPVKKGEFKSQVGDGENAVLLPKGIRVSVPEKYESATGTFPAIIKKYVFDSEFCFVDGYLYEYRLCKGTIRYLRCVLPACPAVAMQNVIRPGVYNKEVTVKTPHNHQPPIKSEMKKQMFYYIMKRKMQSDKTLNFRSVYEDVCSKDPEIKQLVPLRNVINEICRHQLTYKIPPIHSFNEFFDHIEDDSFQKLHFTHCGKQFYQEKFSVEDDTKAVIFANCDVIEQVSFSKLMYVDASFKIDTNEDFKYQLVTILVWVDESYYPILYALLNRKSQEIYKKIFEYLHDVLAPKLRPEEIVTDYEANLYYALGETYLDSHIGGSVFYYTQNLYMKICALNLSRDLETNSYFRNVYHMLLMLPLLPVNTILDGLNNIEIQARDLGLNDLTRAVFDHVRTQWIIKVTPDLFCVHRLENRINENVIAPFKKLRDFLMLSKGKMQKQSTNVVGVVEKLIELESFLQQTYSAPTKKSFARDLSSSQKKNVLKAWQFIESHPKININNFFTKVLGYIKCMENQLWIWGFYRYVGDVNDDLINATNFSIISTDDVNGEDSETQIIEAEEIEGEEEEQPQEQQDYVEVEAGESVVMEAVIGEDGQFVLQHHEDAEDQNSQFENAFLKYVYKE